MSSKLLVNISPPKCGTTAVFHCLTRSFGVTAPIIKEPRFFAPANATVAGNIPSALRADGRFDFGIDWFLDLYKNKENANYLLDFTTYYSVIPETPKLIAEFDPDAKFVLILRDPVAQFVSFYWQCRKQGIELPALSQLIVSDSPLSNFMFSFTAYRDTYDRFCEVFGADRILLLNFDDLRNDQDRITRKISAFLNLNDFAFDPSESEKNVSGLPKSVFLQRLIFSGPVRAVTRLLPKSLKPALLKVRKKIVKRNTEAVKYDPLPDAEKRVLESRLAISIAGYRELLAIETSS